MADKVLFQGGDSITEANLTAALALSNQTDYVVRGLSLTPDFNADELDIGSGFAVIETSNNEAYQVFPDSRSALSLSPTTTNYVYLSIDPATDDSVSYHIDPDDTAPSNPSVKIGEVDTDAETTTDVNRDPDVTIADLTAATLTLSGNQVDADGDGILENADIDALTNLAAGDTFDDYPLHNPDIEALQNFAGGDQFDDYPLHNPDIQAFQNFDGGDQFDGYPLLDADYRRKTSLDSASTTSYTTSDENTIRVDPSSAAVTVTLASADAVDGNRITIWDAGHAASTNNITVDTEGSESFADGDTSKTMNVDGASLTAEWDADLSAWVTPRNQQFETIEADTANAATLQVGGTDVIEVPSTSSSVSLSLGTWRQASSSRPALVVAEARAETDGTDRGTVRFEVDASGGTTADWEVRIADVPPEAGAGAWSQESFSSVIPAGGQYQLNSFSDPNNNNVAGTVREFVL